MGNRSYTNKNKKQIKIKTNKNKKQKQIKILSLPFLLSNGT